jgi:HEAT repeat protein
LGDRKPNIKSLVRRSDVDGLIEAASHQNVTSDAAGAAEDSGAGVRADAVAALGELAPERARTVIRASLYDTADEVRCEAVRALGALHDVEPLAQSLRWLPREELSYELALETLAEAGNSVPPSTVLGALVRREDEELLGEQATQLILSLLDHESVEPTGVLDMLLSALDDERGIVVERAAELLVWLAPDSIEPLVIELDSGRNPAMAAYVLGSIGDPRTLPALVRALRHEDPKVRKESAAALAELQDPAAVKPLLRATRDPEQSVRTQAGMALDGMGSTAVIVGVAALMRPLVEKAVQTAISAESDTDGRLELVRSRQRGGAS